LGEQEKFEPLNRGFDYFYGFLGGERSYFPYPPGKNPILSKELTEGGKPVAQPAYTTLGFGQKAVDFISKQKGQSKPFFLYLAFNAVAGTGGLSRPIYLYHEPTPPHLCRHDVGLG